MPVLIKYKIYLQMLDGIPKTSTLEEEEHSSGEYNEDDSFSRQLNKGNAHPLF
jgi:hypothetical protein